METLKNTFFSRIAWVVWINIVLASLMMTMQLFVSIDLPLDMMMQMLVFILGGYAGTDRIAYFLKSREMPFGEADYGDIEKIKKMVIVTFLLLTQGLFFSIILKEERIPIEGLVLNFTTTSLAYVLGNKAITTAEFSGQRHEEAHEEG